MTHSLHSSHISYPPKSLLSLPTFLFPSQNANTFHTHFPFPNHIMATNAFNSSIHRRRHHSLRRRLLPLDSPTSSPNSFLPRPTPTPTPSLSHSTAAHSTFSPATTPSTSDTDTSLDALRRHLADRNFRQADEETRRLLIALAGDAAQKRGYVFFSEVQFIPAAELRGIDALWRQHSDGRFGYSVQRRIWRRSGRDFTKFFIRVGWMKRLESSEVEQYNYRAFPEEFMWGMEEGTPEGHLPLTNALRGTQLLTSILNHPAFDGAAEDDGGDGDGEEERMKTMGKRGIKTTYTF